MTVVEDFAADYFVVEGLTPGRQHDVRRSLALLEAHAGRPAHELDDHAVSDFVTAQVASGLHVNTVRKQLKAIKPFYGWAWRRRIIDADTYMRISKVRPPRGSTGNARPRPYKGREVRRFWPELDERWPKSTPRMLSRFERGLSKYNKVYSHAFNLQTRAVASLALFGGLRASEIRFADLDDIHPDNDFIVVRNGKSSHGNGNGYREVPYTEQGRRMVGEWLAFRGLCKPSHDCPWLVLTPTASPNSTIPSHPFEPIKRDGFKGLLPTVGAWELHRFRHTCATEWLRAGVKLERLSELLGHASIAQTLCYAKLVPEDVRADVRRAEQDFLGAVGPRFDQLVR